MKATVKMTKVQMKVMERFNRGERLVFLPTKRMSGDAIFWVRNVDESGNEITIEEKALYPQLRRLLWNNIIDMNNPEQVLSNEIFWEKITEDNFSELHREGVIK